MSDLSESKRPVFSTPGFVHGAVYDPKISVAPPPPPPLGPLSAFVGAFAGKGFNTIFRPDFDTTPLPIPVTSDNILELNLTLETLTFSNSLGTVPNRGSSPQLDIFMNGVPYLQTINDITTGTPTGIHFEPGLWINVPPTTNPAEGNTITRMGSIPHGTTITAQGTFATFAGKPTIAPVDITPFTTATKTPVPFPSQTATKQGTPRIPQDLGPFIAAGTITQAILTNPNILLSNAIASQTILNTTAISIATLPAKPLFGGGNTNIAFLLGEDVPVPPLPNAQVLEMTAIFWIETVQEVLTVPVWYEGQPPIIIDGKPSTPGQTFPVFSVTPPHNITSPVQIKVTYTQIQYTQTVFLNFNTLTWPHVSVNTLVPTGVQIVPPSAFA